ncbi:HTTM domain-containing protein [Maribacter sp. 2304DJ31-5]|uniref:HTTM domain-containing protein n=1 Tax=Maribacter sp. 2304DJ31-5 TaxID=3386273 RepID=UPI0039BD8CB3
MLQRVLFQRMDNSPLIIFRIFFGILISMECFGAIATGWVKRNLIDPEYTFPFIDFEWLQPLSGTGMYFYFVLMGLLGICITIGYRYRWSIIAFTVLWTGCYLMQKTAYNNHYYLLILISFLMCFFPANRSRSIDTRSGDIQEKHSMPHYVKWIIVLQLLIVYVYASIAKLYGDWLDFSMIKILMRPKADYFLIGTILQESWIHKIIGLTGIIFDLLIIPALLWKRTRKFAFIISVFFHLFNSIIFQIGIFPYLSLAFSVFFFEPETVRKLFFNKKPTYRLSELAVPSYKNSFLLGFGIYFLIQLLLPLRHYIIKDHVLWTEEGHRMSWRMMLRSRYGTGQFKVINNMTQKEKFVKVEDHLTKSQATRVFSYPDFAWQFAQYLKRKYAEKGESVSVYLTNSKISINGRPYAPFIDPKIDLANTPWKSLEHHKWILPSKLKKSK